MLISVRCLEHGTDWPAIPFGFINWLWSIWIRIEIYEVMKLKTEAILNGPGTEITAIAGQIFLSHLLKDYDWPVEVQLWNGECVGARPYLLLQH